MSIFDFFSEVPTITADAVRMAMTENGEPEFQLDDVRQLSEYAEKHIPGAQLIQLGDLQESTAELDKSRPVILYCASGNRSRTAVSILMNEGFTRVYSMDGGIRAWDGFTAGGPPEFGMILFSSAVSTADHIAVSWVLEEGTRRFYEILAETVSDSSVASVYRMLSAVEQKHKDMLADAYRRLETAERSNHSWAALPFPPPLDDSEALLENIIHVSEAVQWCAGRPLSDVLEYAMAMEAQLMDLYTRISHTRADSELSNFFLSMAAEEKFHYTKFAKLREAVSGAY
ncbi:MAG TPA: hypothetical protein ENN21_07835 [Spirochaetes bacterium]|nr:hypothetical protein [Spirochaetota bacterium]